MVADRQLRVGDRDRDQVATRLAEQYAEGRLTLEEFEVRVGHALVAVTQEDLDVLTVDLLVPHLDRRVVERVLAFAGAAVLATVLVVWGVVQEQPPLMPEVVCGPHVNTDCYWPVGVEPVDY